MKTRSFGLFPPVFYAITHWVWIPLRYECFGNPGVRLCGTRQNSYFWSILGQLCMLLLIDFGSRCDLNVLGTPGSVYVELMKTRSFGLFPPVLYAISHWFWAPLWSERFGNPEVRLRGNHENSQFWPIPASFVCYYSLILVAGAIQTFREPRGPVTGARQNSQFLSILASFVCYYSLILGPALIWTFREPRGPLRVTHENSQFWPIPSSFVCY